MTVTAIPVSTDRAVTLIRSGIEALAQVYGARGAASVLFDEFEFLQSSTQMNAAAQVARAFKYPAANSNHKLQQR